MARGDQLSRQWKIIHTLMASGKGKPAGELAGELDCHTRTVYRDLEALQMAGFPLYTEQNEGKTHWSILDAGRRQMPLPLNLTELMALYFSRNMLKVLQGTAIFDSLTALFEKVKATLPPEYIAYLDKLTHSLEVGVKAYKPYQRFQQILAQVNEAAQNRRYIEIGYFSMRRQELTRRRIAPYKVWFYDETFYIIGFCELRQDVRLFAVDRIETLHICDAYFEPPQDFDAGQFMQASFGVFQGEPVQVRIRFAPAVAGYIREKIWHPTQTLTTQADGGLIFSAEVAGIEEIKHWVLKWGAGAVVMAPEALRLAVFEEIAGMAANYQCGDKAP
ncbi:MAG: transcriptional regulator [Desulfobacteraceae bacterium]|nr:MAG: transcriptional regulator [Desulfobacteraceae bacterium]